MVKTGTNMDNIETSLRHKTGTSKDKTKTSIDKTGSSRDKTDKCGQQREKKQPNMDKCGKKGNSNTILQARIKKDIQPLLFFLLH